jgi:hypothetical protein
MKLWSILRLLIYVNSLSESVQLGTDKELGLGNWKLNFVEKHVGDSPLDRARRKWGNDITT